MLPGLFEVLRGVVNANRLAGRRSGQFLLLGFASVVLVRQSSESLEGHIAYLELGGFSVLGHPVAGVSWEGFVIETLLTRMPPPCHGSIHKMGQAA